MNEKNVLTRHWREMSITTKGSAAFGLLLFLILLVSITNYLSLGTVRRETNKAILTSAEIQRMVLAMDAGLEQARRLERDFFLNYPSVGFEQARQTYARQTSAQIGEVVSQSVQLQQLIAISDVSQALRESNVNLTFYLSASDRYMETFEDAVELVAQLADPDTGLQAQLEQKSVLLQQALQSIDGAELMLFYREMQSWEKEYLRTRQRFVMQSAFNVAFALGQAIEATTLSDKKRSQALAHLDDYVSIAQEIMDLDVAIHGKSREFDLQAQAIDPISEELVALAGDEVERARARIDRTSRFATAELLVVALAGVVLTALTAVVLNNSITRNVVELTRAAAQLQGGNMNARAQVESSDEIGLLAATFNQMAAQLQTLYTSLEQQVAARTARLQKQAVELAQAKEKAERNAQAALEAQYAAEAASRAKSAFLANMSHELRTPLNAILGFTQLMRRDSAFPPAQQENLRIMHQSGEHLLELINDVLEMSKIEAGRATFTETDFDLYQLLATLESMFSARAGEKGLQLCFEPAPEVPQYIRTDERKLRQVLINLLSNAIKFTHTGSVTLRVAADRDRDRHTPTSLSLSPIVRLSAHDKVSISFAVEDTGVGIAPEETSKLFQAFTQTASGQETLEGSGLGLPLSQRFVQLMGGDITVESPPLTSPLWGGIEGGPGSVFRFDIQATVVQANAVQAQRPARRVVGLAPGQRAADGGPYRILVAEDREASRALLVQLLTTVGLEVREAANGQQAIAAWQAWNPHLIWMDMRMPVMDGYQATQHIKSHSLLHCAQAQVAPLRGLESPIPLPPALRAGASGSASGTRVSSIQYPAPIIIALTAHAFEEERAAILAAGCDDLVCKPFREEEVFEVMSQHLGLRYVYEDPSPGVEPASEPAPVALTPADLAALPADWVADLSQAARTGEAERIFELFEQIKAEHAPLTKALAQWVHEFRFDKIVALVESQTG